MRIVLWGELFWPYLGGAELFAARLMDALRPRGFEFAIITSHDHLELPDEARYHDIPIHRFRFREALAPPHLQELALVRTQVAALMRALAPDVIHVNGVGPNAFFCLLAAQATRTPLLVRLNREIGLPARHPPAETLLARMLERAAWVVGVSEGMLATARQLVPAIEPHSSLIYNGVDAPSAMPEPAPAGDRHIVCVGRVVPEKGFDRLLAALPQILRRCPDARLTIAGDGPERAPLQAQAAALALGSAVEFIGWVPPHDVPALLATANVVVVPSLHEGLPAAALQAAAAGRPIVAARTGGLVDIVQHGQTGLLVSHDVAELAAAICAVLEQPVLAADMGRRAWQRARAVFDPQRTADAYDALYRRLADRG